MPSDMPCGSESGQRCKFFLDSIQYKPKEDWSKLLKKNKKLYLSFVS